MIVTNVKQGRKKNVVIYADNKYLTSIPLDVFVKSRIKIGNYIDEEILAEILSDADKHKAKEKALNLISYRSHSKKELKDKIKAKLGEDSAHYATEKMEELGLIDDEKFAKDYACMLKTQKLYSKKLIKFKLLQKGISENIVQSTIDGMDFDEEDYIYKIIEKRYHNKIPDKKTYNRAFGYLQRMGYSFSDINHVLKEFWQYD